MVLVLGSKASVLLAHQGLDTVTGLLAGLAQLRQGDLLLLARLKLTFQNSTHVAGVLGPSAGIILTADKALHTVTGNMAGLAKLR